MDSKILYAQAFMEDVRITLRNFFQSQMEDVDGFESGEMDLDDYIDDVRSNYETEEIVSVLGDLEFDYDGVFETGAEKLVFVPDNEDFVIKMLWDDSVDNSFETDIFMEAKAKNLDDYFLKAWGRDTILIADKFALTFYLQDKIEMNELDRSRKSRWGECSGNSGCRSTHGAISHWYLSYSSSFRSAIATSGFSDVDKLMRFLYDRNINDLHKGNWMVIDGRIKLVDYSGYGD